MKTGRTSVKVRLPERCSREIVEVIVGRRVGCGWMWIGVYGCMCGSAYGSP